MPKETVIKVQNLGKKYQIGKKEEYLTLRDSLVKAVRFPYQLVLGQVSFKKPTFWALKDVSFEVKKGEVLGVIGRNGAGKTTLLKILSRITKPTTGKVTLKGKVASLLEVGTGFHPELTGRENIYLNGSILGMKKKEVEEKFKEIIEFSGIKKFLDTPVKRYSSGMYVRLAFAIAAHLEPEILLIDEVLAGGDAEFQKKCLGKMKEVATGGRTVLFVSHNLAAIRNLSDRVIILEEGRIYGGGQTEKTIDQYLKLVGEGNDGSSQVDFEIKPALPAQFLQIAIKDKNNKANDKIRYQDKFEVELAIEVRKQYKDYYTFVAIYDALGSLIIFTSDEDLKESFIKEVGKGKCQYRVEYPHKLLKPGKYYLTINLASQMAGLSDKHENVLVFEIIDHLSKRARESGGYRPAAVAPEIKWRGRKQPSSGCFAVANTFDTSR